MGGMILSLTLAGLVCGRVSYAQVTAFPVELTMSGPATAVSGDELAYRVHYRLTDTSALRETDIAITIPLHTTLVSNRVISGTPGLLVQTAPVVRWSALGSVEQPEGEIEMRVKVDPDFVGTLETDAYVPGTMTRASNLVSTEVLAPSMQESACGGPRSPEEIAVIGETFPAVNGGTVRIPELELTSQIVDGCFEFRNLRLPRDPMLVTFHVRVEGYRPTTWANYVVVGTGYAPNFTARLVTDSEAEVIDPCPGLLAGPARSAADQQHATLCAQLPNAGTGGSARPSARGITTTFMLLSTVGLVLLCIGTIVAYRRGRAR